MARAQSLAQMALQVRQRVDLGGQDVTFGSNADDNITDVEMTSYLNASVCELFGILVQHFGENYYWAPDYIIPIASGVYSYALPADLLKLVNVDLGLQGSGILWRSILPFNRNQRNQSPGYVGGSQQYLGWSNLRYQMQGQNLVFLPQSGALPSPIRLQYIPEPPLLCATLPTAYAPATAYAQGAQVYRSLLLPTGVATNQVMTALNAGTSAAVGLSPDVGAIGTSTAEVFYKALFANQTITVKHQSGATPSVAVNGNTIIVTLGTDTANQIAALVNADPVASLMVAAQGAGTGTAVTGNVTINGWNVPGTTQDNNILWTYSCPLSLMATTFDGIAGWEDFVILDAAIKCAVKQEMDTSALLVQRAAMLDRITVEAANRQAGDVFTVAGGYGSEEGDGDDDDGNSGFGWGSW